MSDDKSEPATDHKREEARKRGQVLKSQDAIIAVLLFGFAYTIRFVAGNAFNFLYAFFVETFESIGTFQFSFATAMAFLFKALLIVFICVAPTAAFAFLASYIANVAQIGLMLTTKPLSIEDNIKKLNPAEGFKKIFNVKQVVEMLKAFLKILIIALTIKSVVQDQIAAILMSSAMHPAMSMSLAGELVVAIAQKSALAMVAIAVIDYFFQRWQYEKSLRMSKQEIKDEYKKMEGDPLVKSRQRQKQMEMAMSAVHQAVPEADVVIVNPTHYAVALAYKPKQGMKAPKVVAKGKDRVALEIRRIAEENFILIVEDPPTAQALYRQVKIDEDIPPDLFAAVAKIIALLYRRKRPAPPPEITEMPQVPLPYFVETDDDKPKPPTPQQP